MPVKYLKPEWEIAHSIASSEPAFNIQGILFVASKLGMSGEPQYKCDWRHFTCASIWVSTNLTLATTDDWPFQKEEAKNLSEPCAVAMGWVGW